MDNARETAMKVIYAVEFDGAYSNMALKKALSGDLSAKDKAFVSALVYGVLDKKITLDYIISKFSRLKLKKISKYILVILRMGVYQLYFTDKIPESAAVNESVRLAKRYGHSASVGFVNGVLRNAAGAAIEYPTDKNEYLSVKYSFPPELCAKWTRDFGYDFTEELLSAFGENPPLNLRPNTLKITAEQLAGLLSEKGIKVSVHDGYIVSEGFNIAGDDLYRKGFYTVQDAAAMQTARILNPMSGETVIDMCAAPGGKTAHLAELMNNKGKIYAFDMYEHKIELIKKNASRLGADIIDASVSDSTKLKQDLLSAADKVLCDVPCSGLGIIRRKPEIKWKRNNISALYDIQRAILSNGARYLKTGGEIVYSTCTIEKEENEVVTDAFLRNNKYFERIYEKTFYPNTDNTDGFYICKMRKLK